MKNDVLKQIDPDKREWEYDGDGVKIYKPEAGFGVKTPYPWPPAPNIDEVTGDIYTKEPYYVDLPQEMT